MGFWLTRNKDGKKVKHGDLVTFRNNKTQYRFHSLLDNNTLVQVETLQLRQKYTFLPADLRCSVQWHND